nr:hypothetical protein HUO10_000387 [Paraburkholderia busanensis]
MQAQQPPLPTPPDRVITLPATPRASLTPCFGVPDLFTTRLVYLVMIVLFGGFMIALPVAFAFDKTVHMDVVGVLLILLLLAAFGWVLSIPVLAWRKAGGWFVVDEQGFRYGFGPQQGNDRAGVETRVDWTDVVGQPGLRYDVTTEFTGRKSMVKELRFWQRLPSGEQVERRLPLRLADGMLCMRFRNQHELLRAVLRGLAGRPGLRFDANVFLDACIDPDTWLPMRRPRLYETLSIVLACVAVGAFIWMTATSWPLWLVITLAFAAILLMCILLAKHWSRVYPNLEGVLGFRESEPF